MGLITECADVEGRMAPRNLPSQTSQSRVVNVSGPEKEAVGAWYELQRVAWTYAHLIEYVGRESDLAL